MSESPRLARAQLPPIYAIADANVLGEVSLSDAVGRMAAAGLSWIQVRAKGLGEFQLCAELVKIQSARTPGSMVLWVNDRPDLAALFGAEGVHLGQDDLPPSAVRAVVGDACWIGCSTHDLEQLQRADDDPEVDLIALGPIFETGNKANPDPVVGLATLREARRRTEKPLVAIGGLGEESLRPALEAGADSVVLLGALCAGDVESNSRRFAALTAEVVRS